MSARGNVPDGGYPGGGFANHDDGAHDRAAHSPPAPGETYDGVTHDGVTYRATTRRATAEDGSVYELAPYESASYAAPEHAASEHAASEYDEVSFETTPDETHEEPRPAEHVLGPDESPWGPPALPPDTHVARPERASALRTVVIGSVALFFVGFALTLALQMNPAAVIGDPADGEPVLVNQSTQRGSVELDRETRNGTAVTTPIVPAEMRENSTRPADPAVNAGSARERVRNHPNGRLRDRVALDELGRPHGEYASFHPNGAAWESGTFEHGAKTGTWRAYHENGQPRDECEYEGGRAEGVARLWDAEGHLLRETTMHGQPEGPASSWYANGQLESQGSYTNGQRAGPWRFWLADGSDDVQRSGNYVADRKVDG